MHSPSKDRRGPRGGFQPPELVSNGHKGLAVVCGLVCGYLIGYVAMETADHMYGTREAVRLPAGNQGAGAVSNVQQSGGGMQQQQQQQQRQLDVTQQQQQAIVVPQTGGAAANTNKPAGNTIHSMITSNGSPYQNFQGRIMYGTYKLVQQMAGGDKLTGFTRVLHRSTPDELMNEIPTFRADPLHPACDVWCDFPVADRPNAIRQWLDAVAKGTAPMQGAWVLLLECDYVWMKPVAAPDAYDPANVGMQFHFDYIMPTHPDCEHIIKRLGNGVDTGLVPPSGPAPVLIRYTDLATVTPEWERITAAIEADKEAVKVLDWVREMYAWDIALAIKGVKMDTQSMPRSKLIAQPPHDLTMGDAAIAHYTWGALYHENGKEVYRWEKRDYTSKEQALKVPHIPLPPSWHEGFKLQDGLPIGRPLHDTIVAMLTQMNKAIDNLPDLTGKV